MNYLDETVYRTFEFVHDAKESAVRTTHGLSAADPRTEAFYIAILVTTL